MSIQSGIRQFPTDGFVGDFALSGPIRSRSVVLKTTDATQNIIGRAVTLVAGQDHNAVVGGTGAFMGILSNSKQYALLGGVAPLSPTMALPNEMPVQVTSMASGMYVTLSTTANIGDGVAYNNTTGVLAAAPGGTAPSGHTTIQGASVIRRNITTAGTMAIVQLLNGTSGISGTLPVTVPAFKGSVASNTFVPDGLVGGNTRLGSRSPHKMMTSASQIRIVVPAWTVQTNVETNATANITVSASLEYPAGTYTQITFGASTTGTVTAGLELESDLVTAPPIGAKFWVRMLQLCPGGALAFKYCAYDGTGKLSGGTTSGTVPDYVMGGGEWGATTAGTVGFMAMPCAIIADATTVPAVGIGGDSISVGTNDYNDGSRAPLQGQLARAFGALYPTGHFGVYGDNLNAYIASHTKRIRISQYYSHIVYNMGINDIPSRSAAQVQADSNTVTGYHPAGKVAWCTLAPASVTTTDAYITIANQTVSAPKEAARVVVNPQRLTNFPLAATVYDVNPTIENIASPEDGKFSIIGGANTSDGTHWNPNSCSRVAATINPALLVF